MPTINELLRDHVTLDVQCLDRIYLNGYVPILQVPGQLVNFLVRHRKQPVPSPALLEQITKSFRGAVEAYAEQQGTPIVQFEPGIRKDDVAAEQRKRFSRAEGVVFIGVAQEKATAFKAHKRVTPSQYVGFDWSRQSARVTHYYFYIQDAEWGPAFIKVCTYAPYPVKVYLNGHEWVKQQLHKKGLAFEPLDNGFRACENPQVLQATCDELGVEHIQAFFDKWIAQLPWPLTLQDREAGYAHRLSIWQLEVSRTQVFEQPAHGREFFEQVIRENLDLGRPDRVQLVFDRKIIKTTPGLFRTRVIQHGVQPSLYIEYKRSGLKQYFKENRALRTEMTFNGPEDFGLRKDLSQLAYLQKIGRDINQRLLDVQRLSQDCALSQESVERIVRPTVKEDGQRAPGLRFGDPRVMALFLALTLFLHLPHGFTAGKLRQQVADLLGTTYTPAQMSYDLRRLGAKGIIWRVPHSYRYQETTYGHKVALFFSKLNAHVLRPGFAAFQTEEPIPQPLNKALQKVDREIERLVSDAGLKKAA
jgi:hypothetical protein